MESIFLVESGFTVVDEFTLRLWSDKKNLRLKLESPKGLPMEVFHFAAKGDMTEILSAKNLK